MVSRERSVGTAEVGTPVVSVVIPTYRRRDKLPRAVDSVCLQSFEDWELIVVNDDPETAVMELLPEDTRVRCIQHRENRGSSVARNTGIQASSGTYVAFLDDDDAWKRSKLDRQLERFESLDDSYGLIYTGREIMEGGRLVDVQEPKAEGQIFQTLLRSNVIPSPTPLVRAECFETVGLFDPDLRSLQDLDMWLRIARKYQIDVISEPLAITYRGHDDRISQNPLLRYRGHEGIIRKYRKELEKDNQARANRDQLIGINATKLGRRKTALQHLLASARRDLNPRTALYIALNLIPRKLQGPARRTAKRINETLTEVTSTR